MTINIHNHDNDDDMADPNLITFQRVKRLRPDGVIELRTEVVLMINRYWNDRYFCRLATGHATAEMMVLAFLDALVNWQQRLKHENGIHLKHTVDGVNFECAGPSGPFFHMHARMAGEPDAIAALKADLATYSNALTVDIAAEMVAADLNNKKARGHAG